MTLKKRFLRVTNLLFVVLLAVQFLPDKISKDPQTAYVIWFRGWHGGARTACVGTD